MDRLASIVNRGLRDEFGSRTIQQAVSDERNDIMSAMRESVSSKVKELGISIVDPRITPINLPKPLSDPAYPPPPAPRPRVAPASRPPGADQGHHLPATPHPDPPVTPPAAYKPAAGPQGAGAPTPPD